MQIFLKTLTGSTLTFDVEPSDTAGKIKTMLYHRQGIPDGIETKRAAVEEDRKYTALIAEWVAGTGDGVVNDVPGFSRYWHVSFKTLVQRVMRECCVTETHAEDMCKAYAAFLELKMALNDRGSYPAKGPLLSPPEIIDRVWHLHILDTRFYPHEVAALTGIHLHHDPDGAHDPEEKRTRAMNTVIAYRTRFGGDPSTTPESPWRFSPDVNEVWSAPQPEHICPSVNADKQKSGHRGQARLLFHGKQLENDTVLAECGIQHGSCLHMVLRLSGC